VPGKHEVMARLPVRAKYLLRRRTLGNFIHSTLIG
jgi:hypothetical protein